jgi:hypothetical protein
VAGLTPAPAGESKGALGAAEDAMVNQTADLPIAWLKTLTFEARHALGGDLVPIRALPFRAGRENREKTLPRIGAQAEDRRTGVAPPNNDIYLRGAAETISREHFEISHRHDGFFLTDRGSLAGTYVEGRLIGGNREPETSQLADGDIIVVGPGTSGLVYKFVLAVGSNQTLATLLSEVRALSDGVAALGRAIEERR